MKGWWSGGFGYGLWIGVLVASGFSVVPVPSLLWKNKFELSGRSSTKVCLILASRTSTGFSHCYLMQLHLSWKWSWLIYHCVNTDLLNLQFNYFFICFQYYFPSLYAGFVFCFKQFGDIYFHIKRNIISFLLLKYRCCILTQQDESRRVASTLFPTLSPLLKRKKDHGSLTVSFIWMEIYFLYVMTERMELRPNPWIMCCFRV